MTKEKDTPQRTPRRLAAARGERILRVANVVDKTGLSRSQVYRLQDTGEFPRSIRLSANRVGWIESEIETWIAQTIATARASAPAAE